MCRRRHQRLDAAAMCVYDAPTWAERELQRIRDWVAFLYDEPVAPIVLAGFGDAELAAAQTGRLHERIEVGAHNMTQAQRAGELPAERDPEFLAAGTLGGTNAVVPVCLTRDPRPPAQLDADSAAAVAATLQALATRARMVNVLTQPMSPRMANSLARPRRGRSSRARRCR